MTRRRTHLYWPAGKLQGLRHALLGNLNPIKMGFPVLLLLLISTAAHSKDVDMAKGSLRCELRGNENKVIYFGEYGPNNMHFILFSDRDGTKIYQEWNSWGYYSRFFSASERDHPLKNYTLQRRPGEWTKNFPEIHTLNRGEFLVTDINLCDGTWSVTPSLPAVSPVHLVVSPHFQIKKDEDTLTQGVWTGHIKAPPKEIFLEPMCVNRLNKPSR